MPAGSFYTGHAGYYEFSQTQYPPNSYKITLKGIFIVEPVVVSCTCYRSCCKLQSIPGWAIFKNLDFCPTARRLNQCSVYVNAVTHQRYGMFSIFATMNLISQAAGGKSVTKAGHSVPGGNLER